MSSVDISPRDALTRLGASTAEAVAQVLETLVPEQIERGDVTVAADGSSPFAGARFPAVAVRYGGWYTPVRVAVRRDGAACLHFCPASVGILRAV